MTKIAVLDMEGKEVEQMELNDSVFNREINEGLMHQAVVLYLASLRRGTHAVKNRSAVSGGGKKPYRQKGTGHARAGSSRSPIWVGGGTVFGPTPRSYGFSMPKKQRRIALASALSAKMQAGELVVVDKLEMAKLDAANALMVGAEENAVRSARNIVGVEPVAATGVNVYNVLNHGKVILTKDAVAHLEEVLTNA